MSRTWMVLALNLSMYMFRSITIHRSFSTINNNNNNNNNHFLCNAAKASFQYRQRCCCFQQRLFQTQKNSSSTRRCSTSTPSAISNCKLRICQEQQHKNYQIIRRHLFSSTSTSTSTSLLSSFRSSESNEMVGINDDPLVIARETFRRLASRGKSWHRLRHLVEMAMNDYNCQYRDDDDNGNGNDDDNFVRDEYDDKNSIDINIDQTMEGGKEENIDKSMKRNKLDSVADIGTDHGLLAMSLALSGRFDSVVGVDVSAQALEDGGIALLRKVQTQIRDSEQITEEISSEEDQSTYPPLGENIPLTFRHSNGLEKLQFGEADIVCIAGMGVNTMIKILTSSSSSSSSPDDDADDVDGIDDIDDIDDDGSVISAGRKYLSHLERIGCKQLLLQPTTSRPRNLILLYDTLQENGWTLQDERIEKLSSRYYITSCFIKLRKEINKVPRNGESDDASSASSSSTTTTSTREKQVVLPGSILVALDPLKSKDNSIMVQLFKEYCQHHITWLQNDAAISPHHDDDDDGGGDDLLLLDDADRRWLSSFYNYFDDAS